jgi:hypothetical protein
MKTSRSDAFVPKAQREVWEWKDAIYREVRHLPFDQAVKKIAEQSAQAARELGFSIATSPSTHLKVAESRVEYKARTSKRTA